MKSIARVSKSGHKACINCVDGTTIARSLIATGSEDKTVRIWDVRVDKAIKCITQCFESSVEAVKFGISDDYTIYAASDRVLFSFDLRTEGIVMKSPITIAENAATDDINCLDLSSDGNFIAVADDAGIITIVNSRLLTANNPKRLQGHTSIVNAVAFSPINNLRLMSGGFDYILNSWDIDTSVTTGNPAASANLSKLGNEANDGVSAKSINPPFIQAISYTCNGRALAIALGDGSLKVVAADDPKSLWAVASDAHAGMTTALFCSGDSIVYTGGIDRTIKCWKIEDNLVFAAKLESDQSFPSVGITVDEDGDIKAKENLDEEDRRKRRDKKKKKKNRRFANDSYRMKLVLHWDEDHFQKVNVISGFRITNNDIHSNQIFVGDVTSNLSIYTLE